MRDARTSDMEWLGIQLMLEVELILEAADAERAAIGMLPHAHFG